MPAVAVPPGGICPRTLEEHPPPLLPLAGRNVWAGLLEAVMDDPDYEWLMIDASYIKADPYSAGARGATKPLPAQTLNSKLHLAVDSHGMPVSAGDEQETV